MDNADDTVATSERELIRLLRIVDDSTSMMIKKNRERGSCSDQIGLLGLFLEIRTTYLRLRSLIWDKGPPIDVDASLMDVQKLVPCSSDDDVVRHIAWHKSVKDTLRDMRNYTVLSELALIDNNMKGAGDDSKLSKRKNH